MFSIILWVLLSEDNLTFDNTCTLKVNPYPNSQTGIHSHTITYIVGLGTNFHVSLTQFLHMC